MSWNEQQYKDQYDNLPSVDKIEYVVYSDLDETLYCHNANEEQRKHLKHLEWYLQKIMSQKNVLFGVITGSSIDSALKKLAEGNYGLLPHFIASDLGTMIYWINHDGSYQFDTEWTKRINDTFFEEQHIHDMVNKLAYSYQIYLSPQTQMGVSPFKKNYYYYITELLQDEINLETIRRISSQYGVEVNINRCNPLAGDPEDAYDVDFVPRYTGKGEIVKFINNKYNIDDGNTFAFGDSGNDLDMLTSVRHGYLLSNATDEAKQRYKKVTLNPYTLGILEILKEHFDV